MACSSLPGPFAFPSLGEQKEQNDSRPKKNTAPERPQTALGLSPNTEMAVFNLSGWRSLYNQLSLHIFCRIFRQDVLMLRDGAHAERTAATEDPKYCTTH